MLNNELNKKETSPQPLAYDYLIFSLFIILSSLVALHCCISFQFIYITFVASLVEKFILLEQGLVSRSE